MTAHLTPAGQDVLTRCAQNADAVEACMLGPLNRQERARLLDSLSRAGDALASLSAGGHIKQEYAYLRADFGNRGRLADEYISAIRELFESDTPEFHGPHINYSDVLFSPRPSARIPLLVGGNSPAALRRAATLGDGWYGLGRSPDQVRGAVAEINEFGRKAQFEVSVRVVTRIGPWGRGAQRFGVPASRP